MHRSCVAVFPSCLHMRIFHEPAWEFRLRKKKKRPTHTTLIVNKKVFKMTPKTSNIHFSTLYPKSKLDKTKPLHIPQLIELLFMHLRLSPNVPQNTTPLSHRSRPISLPNCQTAHESKTYLSYHPSPQNYGNSQSPPRFPNFLSKGQPVTHQWPLSCPVTLCTLPLPYFKATTFLHLLSSDRKIHTATYLSKLELVRTFS